jgi:hypothetical protein
MKAIICSLLLIAGISAEAMDEMSVRKDERGIVAAVMERTEYDRPHLINTLVIKHSDGSYTESAVRICSAFGKIDIQPSTNLVTCMKAAIKSFEAAQEKK